MKKTIKTRLSLGLLLVAGASPAFAQTIGTVTFNTFNANSSLGQVFLMDGVTGPGPNCVGQLWWSDTSNGTFVPAGTPQTFLSSPNSTYIADGSVAVPGRAGGAIVFFQMRVWNASAGSDWCTAIGNPPGSNPLLTAWGITQTKSRILGGFDSDDNIFNPQQFDNFANLSLNEIAPIPACAASPTPSTLVFSNSGSDLILSWNGPFILQSATNAAGVYADLPVSRIPYTNNMIASPQQFFRLRN